MNKTLYLIAILLILIISIATSSFAQDNAAGSKDAIPVDISSSTLAIFTLNPSGEANTKYYAAAFAVALSDRLYCAPTCITQQHAPSDIAYQLLLDGVNSSAPISEAAAKKTGKELGVRYIVTGNMNIAKGNVTIRLNVTNLESKSASNVIKTSGTLAKLPSMQVYMAQKIAGIMKLNLTKTQADALKQPNFTNPKALLLYGQAYFCKDMKQSIAYQWQAAQADSNSLFTTIRLLEYYACGPTIYKDLMNETRLPDLANNLVKRYPGNSHLEWLKGMLWAKISELSVAQTMLTEQIAVDPRMYRAHAGLVDVAINRRDAALAINEGKVLIAMWPNNPYAHVSLSRAYKRATDNMTSGYGNMPSEIKEKRNGYMGSRRLEVNTAIKLNRNCFDAWKEFLWFNRISSNKDGMDKACKEMLRLQPKNYDAYSCQVAGVSPQWGGCRHDRAALQKQVEKVFGKDSFEAAHIRLEYSCYSFDQDKDRDKLLALADDCIRKSKSINSDVLSLKYTAMINGMGHVKYAPEALKLAKQAYDTWHTPEWCYAVGLFSRSLYSSTYATAPDVSLFDDALRYFSVYAEQVPYEPSVHDALGDLYLYSLNKYDEAKKHYEKALELNLSDQYAKSCLEYISKQTSTQAEVITSKP